MANSEELNVLSICVELLESIDAGAAKRISDYLSSKFMTASGIPVESVKSKRTIKKKAGKRGRPAKIKAVPAVASTDVVAPEKKKRGRPAKKKRGRPAKATETIPSTESSPVVVTEKKKRGRPAKKRRGRPAKIVLESAAPAQKKKRGRPASAAKKPVTGKKRGRPAAAKPDSAPTKVSGKKRGRPAKDATSLNGNVQLVIKSTGKKRGRPAKVTEKAPTGKKRGRPANASKKAIPAEVPATAM